MAERINYFDDPNFGIHVPGGVRFHRILNHDIEDYFQGGSSGVVIVSVESDHYCGVDGNTHAYTGAKIQLTLNPEEAKNLMTLITQHNSASVEGDIVEMNITNGQLPNGLKCNQAHGVE